MAVLTTTDQTHANKRARKTFVLKDSCSFTSYIHKYTSIKYKFYFRFSLVHYVGRNNSVGIATHYGLYVPGIEPRCCQFFCTRPHRPSGPSSLLYSWYRVSFPGVKRPGRGVDHTPPPPSSAEFNKKDRYTYPLPPHWCLLLPRQYSLF